MPPRRTKASKSTPASQAAQSTSGNAGPSLLSLPLDALEAIGAPLELADRIRLASCCRGLRSRTASSAALWGDLIRRPAAASAAKQASLEAWLAAHKGGLRKLCLHMYMMHGDKAEAAVRLLRGIAGSPLADLVLYGMPSTAALQPLAQLTRLSRLALQQCGIAALPPELAALPLAALELSFCERLGAGGDAAFQPLAQLGRTLRELSIAYCSLSHVPAPLGALTALEQLELHLEESKTAGSPGPPPPAAPCQPLQHLAAVTRLKLSGTGFRQLPAEIAAMRGLKAADFAGMYGVKAGTADAWAPLQHLTVLTSLVLGSGMARRLPAQLAACTGLLELDVSSAHGLGSADSNTPDAWAPLARLGLTKLVGARGVGCLPMLPPSLLRLDAASQHDWGAASEGDLAPLSRLTALTRLDLSRCGMQCFPRALSMLGALNELLLEAAHFSELPEAAFQPLACLTALTRLSFSDAQLAAVPPAPSAATALVELDLGGSKWAPYTGRSGDIVFLELGHLSRLGPLTNLRRLVLWNTGTRRLPPELSSLARLEWLALSQCEAMGQGGDASFEPLRRMTSLTELILENTGLRAPPSQLSALAALRLLDLSFNPSLGRAPASAWRPLAGLRCLRIVKLTVSGLRALPAPLAPLQATGTEFDLGYATEEEYYANVEER